MRFTTILAAIAVVALGHWAYHQTIQTQMAEREVRSLERQISAQAERLSVLRAEWAYLNRPDRLRDLAAFNFDRLGLLPLAPSQFADPAQIPFPQPELELEPTAADVIQENASIGDVP